MPTKVDATAIKKARALRRNMTDGEKRLWSELREFRRWYGIHVRRQAPIGPYFPDFVVQEHKLIIEVDGEHHNTDAGRERDAKRDAWLGEMGYRVVRIATGELADNFDGCVETILRELALT